MITITNVAKQKLKNLIVSNSGKSAYLYLKSGGCNGFNHTFSILDKDENGLYQCQKYIQNNRHKFVRTTSFDRLQKCEAVI